MSTDKQININIIKNINRIKSTLGNSTDLIIRQLDINHFKLAVFSIKDLANNDKLDNLSLELNKLVTSQICEKNTLEAFYNKLKALVLCETKLVEGSDYETLYDELLSGNTIILIDGYYKFLSLYTYGPESRSITEPTSQTIIRGSKEAFTEKLTLNIALIRKRVKDKSLKVEELRLGSITKTKVAIIYLNNIAKPDIVNEIRSRLNQIEIDGILESGYIEELIKDDPYSVFPTFLNSERPDAVTAGLLEGKVAILVDGSPYILTAPALFADFLQVSEDYYHHFFVSSMTRIIREIAFFLTLMVPSLYIALTTFHQEMIPTTLLISIAAQREGVPFPAFVEAIFMELTFEILREAGIRMPRVIGPAISIVGALVLGQEAVEAGFISAAIVIVVSITAIASFAIPNYAMSNAVRVLRFFLMILSATFGLFGIYMAIIALTLHLCKLKSVGVPYLTPLAPRLAKENKDTIVRFPLWKMKYRPSATAKTNDPRIKKAEPVKSDKKQEQEFK